MPSISSIHPIGRTIAEWLAVSRDPAAARADLLQLPDLFDLSDPAWISIADRAAIERQFAAATKCRMEGADLPLFGVPFAVKDNIDVAGFATTAACPAFAYHPGQSATVISRLVAAGAIVVGKTNLDQFATGLVGTRSPFGAVPNAFNPAYVSGGSSSGSASVVARGLVPFALGTDTAGSGRVPAGANNIVGLKPTRGAWSNAGLVPACRSLDCITVMATHVADALCVDQVVRGHDPRDALSREGPPPAPSLTTRPRLGIPIVPQFFDDAEARAAWFAALDCIDADWVALDFLPLHSVAALLYDGPWVAERLAAIDTFFAAHAHTMDATVRSIIGGGARFSAVDMVHAQVRLTQLAASAQAIMAQVDALLVPTVPAHPTIDAVIAEPIALNSRIGTYTNFVNLLDWSALAVPAGFRRDGLPFGLTLIGPAWAEHRLAGLAARWERQFDLPRGATGRPLPPQESLPMPDAAPDMLRLAVVGAHLTGMPLNHELTERGATFVESTVTSDHYRLYALAGTVPPKPGLARQADGQGAAIALELWDIPLAEVGSFLASIPAPLGLGSIELGDGRAVKGFICEGHAVANAADITGFGGWRAYRAAETMR